MQSIFIIKELKEEVLKLSNQFATFGNTSSLFIESRQIKPYIFTTHIYMSYIEGTTFPACYYTRVSNIDDR